MSRTIQWGILGCGRIAEKFASDMALVPDARLIACASKDTHKSMKFAEKYQIPYHYGDYRAMLASDAVDVVYVATTHNFHDENIILCLEHGKHVLCEKPMCVSMVALERVVALAKERRLFLMEAMWTAFLPAFQELLADCRTGAIGDIRYMKADFGFFSAYDPKSRLFDPALAGGCILDIGIYPLFVALGICGKPSKTWVSKSYAPSGVENEAAILIHFESGAHASLYSTVTCNTSNTLEIFGTKGTISVPSRFHEMTQYTITDQNGQAQVKKYDRLGYGYAHEIIHVTNCVRKSMSESDVMTFEKSLELMEMMQLAIKY
jgi:predicted dehydrogenase